MDVDMDMDMDTCPYPWSQSTIIILDCDRGTAGLYGVRQSGARPGVEACVGPSDGPLVVIY